jgi:ATP-binding cassette subfamily B protein
VSYFRRVLPYVRPYWRLAVCSTLLTVLAAGVGLLAPWPLTLIIDHVLGAKALPPVLAQVLDPIAGQRVTLLLLAVGAGLLITAVGDLINIASNFVNTKLEQRIVLDFRADLFRHAQRLSVSYTDQVSTGRLMYGINFEAAAAGGLVMAVQPLAQSALTMVGMFVVSLSIDMPLALLSITIVPFLYYAVGYYATHIQTRLMHVKGLESESLSIVHEAMQLLRVIVAFGREDHESRRFFAQGRKTVDARVKVTVQQTMFTLAVNATTAVGSALVLGVGALHAIEGRLSPGQLLVVLAYIASIYKPLEAISYTIGSLQDRFVGLRMAFHVLDTPPSIAEAPDAISMHTATGHVVYDDVSFNYPSRSETLSGISFEVRAGQVVAVVGPTGAGKTTLTNLLTRFYDPNQGRVLLDGVDVRTLTLESLRRQISLVPQEPLLFSGSIADNIGYGRLEATREEVEQAAMDANAHDFICQLPNGYATQVGERGAQLSGGERQRLCVARAFLKNAPILILDEPTSSIDARTEGIILDALDRLMVGRTTFVIAHRLSTIRNADLIVVLERGRLVESGSHDDLLGRAGLYRQLYDTQLGHRRKRRLMPELEADIAPALSAGYHCTPPLTWTPGEIRRYAVDLTNRGARSWPAVGAQPVRLGVHFGGPSDAPHDGWLTDDRIDLSRDVAPGGLVTVDLEVIAPTVPGHYVLRHRVVQENVAWCDDVERTDVEITEIGAGVSLARMGVNA